MNLSGSLLSTVSAAALVLGSSALAQDKKLEIPPDKDPITTASGLKYSVLVPGGEGVKPKLGDRVKVHYTGWLESGEIFDSSVQRGRPSEFVLGNVVEGWNQGLALMTPGAKYKLTIPGELGYGPQGRPPKIGPNATLIFEVELLEVFPTPVLVEVKAEDYQVRSSGLKFFEIQAGQGEVVTDEDVVELSYALWNPSGKLLDCSARSGNMIKSPIADLPFPFLKEGAQLLKTGSVFQFEVPASLAFGGRAMPDLPANSITYWQLELKRLLKPLPLPAFELPPDTELSTTASGLKHKQLVVGEGRNPRMGQEVRCHYAGWLTDGTVFDSSFSRGEPTVFRLGRVIQGWNEGLQLMNEGGRAIFVVPGNLAYGPGGSPPKIGPNATLVFYVELIDVLD